MLIRKLFVLICTLSIGSAWAQTYTSSPFSAQGLGEEGALNDGLFSALGNVKAAVIDSNVVNCYNPSSYAFLSKGQPLFNMGLSSRASSYKYGASSANGLVVGLTQIVMVLPLNKRLGMAAGLQPFSRKGYAINSNDALSDDSISYSFLGSGSTNKVFVGLSYKMIATRRHELAFGGNAAYLFGSVTNERRAVFKSLSPAGGIDLTTYRLNSVYYDLGATYRLKFDDQGRNQLTIGAIVTPEQLLNANLDYGLFYSDDVTDQTQYDTIVPLITNDNGTIRYPQSTTIGFNYAFRPLDKESKLKSIYQISVYADYTKTQWSRFSTEFAQHTSAFTYQDATKWSFGVQYTPSFEFMTKAAGAGFAGKLRYRAGFYTATLPMSQNGIQVSERAISAGIGIPFAALKSNSVFNIGVLYGSRSNGTTIGLSENFLSLNFGIVLAPSSYEKWFKKYKLD